MAVNDYGFRVYNSAGFVQIDSAYQNLGLKQKGSVYCGSLYANTGTEVWYYGTFTVNSVNNPIIATASGRKNLVLRVDRSGNSITYTVMCAGAPDSIPYYVFDIGAEGAGTYGLKVWNASGAVVYDSNIPYLNVVGTQVGDTNNESDPLWLIESSYGRGFSSRGQVAVVQGQLCYQVLYFSGEDTPPFNYTQNFLAIASSVSGSSATWYHTQLATAGPFTGNSIPSNANQTGYAFLVVDVTGY